MYMYDLLDFSGNGTAVVAYLKGRQTPAYNKPRRLYIIDSSYGGVPVWHACLLWPPGRGARKHLH